MLDEGEVVALPADTGVEVPTPLFIKSEAAFVLVHDNADAPPADILAGLAESVQVGFGAGGGGGGGAVFLRTFHATQ